MSKLTNEKSVVRLAVLVAIVFALAALGAVGFEAYVRWFINQEFSVLGGNALGALIVGSSAIIVGLLFSKKTSN